jgi:hypothetical protein
MAFSRYILIVLLLAGALFGGREAWQETIKLGCLPPGGVKPADGWLYSCASDRVGAFDESVIWFATEHSIPDAIAAADLLIFGDSRIEYAISRGGAAEWFSSKGLRFYLLAFGGGTESGEARMLLMKYRPHPAVVLFNVDPYFTGSLSPPAQSMISNPDQELQTVLETQSFLTKDATYCRYIEWLCGRTSTVYRAYSDGHLFVYSPERFLFGKALDGRWPVLTPPPWDTSPFETYLKNARELISVAGIDPKCVVFTNVPNSEANNALAEYLAQKVGGTAIVPHLEGLFMSDGTHLTVESSKRWTPLLLDAMEPILRQCKRPQPILSQH